MFFGIVMCLVVFSCKKDYICECTYKGGKTSHPLDGYSKKDAKDECSQINTYWEDKDGKCAIE